MQASFAPMVAALFAGPLGSDALYTPPGDDAVAIPLRVLPSNPDEIAALGAIGVVTEAMRLCIPSSIVAEPQENAILQLVDDAGEPADRYVVKSWRADRRRLKWHLDLEPAPGA